MISEEEALSRILDAVAPLEPEDAQLLEALGRFASVEVRASHALPPFDNSAMDGYALPHSTGRFPAGAEFTLIGEQPAGPDRALAVERGQAIRIFTGAPTPRGTGAVVMQEDVERRDSQITLKAEVEPGEFIRRAGSDLARGESILLRGDRLTAGSLSVLASQGRARVRVVRRPRVAVLTTGDELRPAGEPLGPGEIYESNSVLLAALATAAGAAVTILGPARDERPDLDAKLALGLADQDAMVIAGGVSVGERDLVRERLAAAGVSLDLWRVRMRPGKPFAYGRSPSGTHIFGLPGNPVSAFVTFLVFVRPALLRLAGAPDDKLAMRKVSAFAGRDLVNHGDRPHYLRGHLDHDSRFWPGLHQQSHALAELSRSTALVRVAPDSVIAQGAPVDALTWD